ncbi:MAG: discoidin domain-containing protein [Flavobacteriia bacterium]|jgi:hypothetical protein
MSRLPQSFIKSLDDIAKAKFYEARQRYLLHLGESLIMHVCSFVLAEYKESGTHLMTLEKEIINSKKSLSVGTYVGWVRNTSQHLAEIQKPSLLDDLIRKEENNEVLSNFIACIDILKKVVESGDKDNLYERCIQARKGVTLKKCNLNQFFGKFVELRNKIAHPIYEVKGKTINWPFTDDCYRFILEPLELAIQGVLDQLNPLWDYDQYIVSENDKNVIVLNVEDGDLSKRINVNLELPEGVRVLLNSNEHLLPADWKVLLQPDPMAVERIKLEQEELRKMTSLSEFKEHVIVALEDKQISMEEFRFLESVSRTKLGLNSDQVKEIILETANELGIEDPFPEIDTRFIEAIDSAIRNKTFNELVLKLMGEQYGVHPNEFDKIVDSRAYALGVDPLEARKSETVSFSKEELSAFHSLTIARTWIMSMERLNHGGATSNYKIVGDSSAVSSKEYWHKFAFTSLEQFVKLRLKTLQTEGGLEWGTKQNQWQIGNMASYAWCSIFPKNAITKAALSLHLSLYGSGSMAVGFLPDWKDQKSIAHYGLLLSISRRNLFSFLLKYDKEFRKYKNLVLWNSNGNGSYASIGEMMEKYPWTFHFDYGFEQIQFIFDVQQTTLNPELIVESFDITFNLFNVLIPEIIQDYENSLIDIIDPLANNEAAIRSCLNEIETVVERYFKPSGKVTKDIAGTPQGGKMCYRVVSTVDGYIVRLSYDFIADYITNEVYLHLTLSSAGRTNDYHSSIDDVLQKFHFSNTDFERNYRPGHLVYRKSVSSEEIETQLAHIAELFISEFSLLTSRNYLDYLGLTPVLDNFNSIQARVDEVMDNVLNSELKNTFSNAIKVERENAKGLYYLDYVAASNKKQGYHWIGWGLNVTDPTSLTIGLTMKMASVKKGPELANDFQRFVSEHDGWELRENGNKPELADAQWGREVMNDDAYSSSSDYNKNHSAKLGRLNCEPKYANWSSKKCDENQWIQIDLGEVKTTWGVCTQGRYNSDQWVKSYRLLISSDGKNWDCVGEDIIANFDRDSLSEFLFDAPKLTRFVRFQPTSWHQWISMRVDVLFGDAPDYSMSASKWLPLNDQVLLDFPEWIEKEVMEVKKNVKSAFSFK